MTDVLNDFTNFSLINHFIPTEYLITNCHTIFDASEDFESKLETSGCETIEEAEEAQTTARDHDLTVPISIERPKSLGVSGARLISLEEAQNRHNRIEFIDLNKMNPMNTPGGSSSYIEVGGGPSSLPDKYAKNLYLFILLMKL